MKEIPYTINNNRLNTECPYKQKSKASGVIMVGSLECSLCKYYIDVNPSYNGDSVKWLEEKREISKIVFCNYEEKPKSLIRKVYKRIIE